MDVDGDGTQHPCSLATAIKVQGRFLKSPASPQPNGASTGKACGKSTGWVSR
ncbi:hypothetical protein ACIQV2_27540 [Streptomyces globosus]|uniref:hypothetical protein n=1 Tax=Streptomyces globosus TaxID=68209 RepID=UPI0038091D23